MEIINRKIPMEELAQLIALQLANGGRAKLTVTGCSMLPLLREQRDSVELIAPATRQKTGDIILYQRENGQYILHRIVALTETGYLCCGDNQAKREVVDHSQLLAVVDGFRRKGKDYDLDHILYRLYLALWVGLFPLRGVYIKLRRFLGTGYRAIKKR